MNILYRRAIRPLLFRRDPEAIHDRAISIAESTGRQSWLCSALARYSRVRDLRLATTVAGLSFENPLGLAAGFDKNGRAVRAMGALGFGHVEIGSISADRSLGNPRPRLFRIVDDCGIVVYYGLPNDGADRVAERLAGRPRTVPLGINLVNTNRGPNAPAESDQAILEDYLLAAERLTAAADYFCLNLSCPNTCDGRGFFGDRARLRSLLAEFERRHFGRPLFLKVAPFATPADLDSFLAVAHESTCVAGFAVNLPPGKSDSLVTPPEVLARMPGAVSGRPCETAINRTVKELYQNMDRQRFHLIAAGGVFSAEDAYRKIRLGASLVQLFTALIYEGPGIVPAINRDLTRLLTRDGFRNVAEAVGVDSSP